MIVQPALKKKNFGLTEQAFQKMVSALKEGNNEFYERSFLAHFGDCCNYLQQRYKADQEDAYDATMETMLVFCNRLKAGKIRYGNIRFLFTQMAGQTYLSWKKKAQKITNLENIDLPEVLPEKIDQETRKMLADAWGNLGKPCQQLLKDFYYEDLPSKEIAKKLDRSDAAVRKQKQRCIEKLRAIFKHYL